MTLLEDLEKLSLHAAPGSCEKEKARLREAIQRREAILDLVERLVEDAYAVEECFNPETYIVQAEYLLPLAAAYCELVEKEMW